MNLDIKQISAKIMPLIERLRRYAVLGFFVLIAFLFGFLILRISSYAQTEPSEDAVTEKLTTVQRPKIDQNALLKIQQLEDQNVEVKSLFERARDNPFSE